MESISRAHPPAPWRLFGRALLLPALAGASVPATASSAVRGSRRRSPGGLLLAAYDSRSTLAYHELLGVGGVRWRGGPAARIAFARVDDDSSVSGGREIWGIPKLPATFEWDETERGLRASVTDGSGHVVGVRAAARPRALPVPVLAPFVGADGTGPAWVSGVLRATPVSVRVEVPGSSALAELRLEFASVGFLGDVALRVSAPRAA